LLVVRGVVVAALLTYFGAPITAVASTYGYGQGEGDSANGYLGVGAVSPSPQGGGPTFSKSSSLSAVPAGMRILVRFRADASDAQRADAVRSVNGWIDSTIPALGLTRIALPNDAADAVGDGPAVAAVLARDPAVESAEFDSSVRLSFTPSDPFYATDPYVGLGQWGIRKAFVDRAWDTVRGSPSVTVAVLDTGVDPDHPDLRGALVPGTALVSQPSAECVPNTPNDDNSHGTHVAGIIGASANNGNGIAGVAFGARVMALKVLDCTGVGALSDVASGLVWAVDHGARVINISLGSPFDSGTMRSAVTYAISRNVLVVSAAGNCGTSGDRCTSLNQPEYPAAYPDVLAVGATDTDDSVAFFSSRNFTVDVAAPGRRIVSTTPGYKTYLSTKSGATLTYGAFSGTSQASPFVAGLAALVWSAEPGLTVAQVIQRIEDTADQLAGAPGTRNDGYGYGRVNALRAVTSTTVSADRFGVTYDTGALPKSAATGKSFIARIGLGNTSSFTWRAADTAVQWSWLDLAGAPVAGQSGTVPLPADVAAGASASVTGQITVPATAGAYTLKIDLARAGVLFSTKGAPPATLGVVVGSGFGATYAPAAAGSASFDLGATTPLTITLTNTGTATWPAAGPNPVRLSYHWLSAGAVVQWEGLRASLPGDVTTGGTVTVALPVMPPDKPGTYTLRLDLVQEGVSWFSGLGVPAADLAANVRSAYVATYGAAAPPPVLLPGGRSQTSVTITNAGSAVWSALGANPVRVAAHVTDAKGATVIWDGARTALASDVAPGQAVTVKAIVDAPLAPGPYRLRVDLVREGVAWFSSLGVPTADLDLLVAADQRAAMPSGTLTVSRADPTAQVTIKNVGIATWTPIGTAPVDVAVHWYDAAGTVLLWDGPRTPLPAPLGPNESVTLAVRLGAPPAGAAFVAIDLVSEGLAWFGVGPLRAVILTP
jgi:subtilisin family serine protease